MHSDAPAAVAMTPIRRETAHFGETGSPHLELANIVQRWGTRTVLEGVSLSLPAGSVGWLGGPNGSGKTTLLRIAAGILVPASGTIALTSLDPERDRRAFHRRLGYLSAGDRGLYARLTAVQNLEFWAGIALVPRRRRKELIDAAVERFELEALARTRVDRQSMGQRQRVRLAMAFLHEPAVVLLDEPQTSLDESALALLDAALHELAERGGAALWCSPVTTAAALRADVRYRLQDGQVLAA